MFGEQVLDASIQIELATLGEHEQRHSSQRFCDGADLKKLIRAGRNAAFEIGQADCKSGGEPGRREQRQGHSREALVGKVRGGKGPDPLHDLRVNAG
jgi:hypothetical protein